MAINIKFDLAGNPEPPTIILTNRSGKKLGQLIVDEKSIDLSDAFNDASEFSFTLNKYIDGKIVHLWDKVVNFKLVYCKEWDMYFEIRVELDESSETVKTVYCTQLGQAELSQIKVYNMHINEDGDPNWDNDNTDYKISILYDPDNPDASILHRLLEKAPHYSIKHVDDTIKNIQRSFSFDDTSIYDAFQDVAEEIGCFFDFHSNSGEDGKIQRTFSVYDLQQYCNKCGHRGEFTDECPKCESTDITKGYGEDTLIFVTADELASDGIQLTTDTDSVKNCFKLEAGDELMTATVRNCNPNGTDYIWYFSNDIKEDMSKELVEKLELYDEKYKECYNEEISLNETSLNEYNELVNKYKDSYNAGSSICFNCDYKGDFEEVCPKCGSANILVGDRLQEMSSPVLGYSDLMNAYYDTIDFSLYLTSGLMPSVETSNTNAEEQIKLLTPSSLSPIAVTNIKVLSTQTAENAIVSMAKTIVKSTYKVEAISVDEEENPLTDNGDGTKTWKGTFTVENYSDEKDKAESDVISIIISDNYEAYVGQKIEKALNKEDTEDLSISGLFKKEIILSEDGAHDNDNCECAFCTELKKYALNPLETFSNACQACIDILTEQGAGNEIDNKDLYKNLYEPYRERLSAIEYEVAVRKKEIGKINNLQANIEERKIEIQDSLNFENYLNDEELWIEFCSYRREDKYLNENYTSDGLNNAKLFERALEFYDVAENEIYKSSELQHSISTTLNNLLAIPKFKSLVKSFKVGNWIRVRVDNKVYKLRLLKYDISYGDFDNIKVEFSEVDKIKNGITDTRAILSQASSMASSYSSVKRQASQGEKSNIVVNNWIENGLNLTDTRIVDSYDENLLFDKNGFWCRRKDPMTGDYENEQIKIVGSTIAITDNGWDSTKTAIGKIYYIDPSTGEEKTGYGINGEIIVGRFILGENIIMQNKSGNMVFDGDGLTITSVSDDGVGTMTFDENGLIVQHGDNVVTISPKSKEVMNITNGEDKVFEVDENGELSINGNIIARSLRLESGVKIDSGVITNLANVATSGSYEDLIDTPTKLSDFENDSNFITKAEVPTKLSSFENDSKFITKEVNDLTNYYNKNETDTAIENFALPKNQGVNNAGKLLYVDESGNTTSISIDELKELLNI